MMAASNGNGDTVDAQFILPIDTGDEDVRIENDTEEREALTVTSPAQSTTSIKAPSSSPCRLGSGWFTE